MTKDKKDAGKRTAERVKSPCPRFQSDKRPSASLTIRKIMTPVKRGTVSRSAIRKAVREVIAARSVSNAS